MTWGSRAISFLSGEWMLSNGRPNGGDVVVFRTLWVGVLLIGVLATIRATSSAPCSTIEFIRATWTAALKMLREPEGPLIFGVVYAALYARFASQWAYMANLYNLIKQTEVTAPVPTNGAKALSQWKAGFIEDALAVHMATKPTIAGVIRAWYAEPDVKAAFERHTSHHHSKVEWLQEHGVLE